MKCYCNDVIHDGMQVTDNCFRELWLFEDLTDEENAQCRTIGSRGVFHSGQAIFLQGDSAQEMFLIKAGRIKLSKVLENGTEVILDFRKAGDMIGENMICEEIRYPVTAWAMEDTITCGFNKNRFETLIGENPGIGLRVIKNMGKRISALTHRLGSVSSGNLVERLYQVLTHIAEEHGVCIASELVIGFPLTHEELGFLLGAHRVSITRAMKELIQSEKVIISDRTIKIPLPA
ncbi:Crp/Fnr family transcriptional regulator [Desulfobacula phenolica]|uniref:CRP/FNR family transcriptional regulator, anaerobic regulatory protein n=1 Tax=Desulfobacula phenolica TaxID=90732 RepID=A0A1H2E1S6_9BACT|nr:Crp/Fnr family transcriptional regulator [Desulfobacula phenolica]SDT88658.1 CRP/FNR family transcriptional regulator, anaerobic regulatory protein [Desulfobacula phenolica]